METGRSAEAAKIEARAKAILVQGTVPLRPKKSPARGGAETGVVVNAAAVS